MSQRILVLEKAPQTDFPIRNSELPSASHVEFGWSVKTPGSHAPTSAQLEGSASMLFNSFAGVGVDHPRLKPLYSRWIAGAEIHCRRTAAGHSPFSIDADNILHVSQSVLPDSFLAKRILVRQFLAEWIYATVFTSDLVENISSHLSLTTAGFFDDFEAAFLCELIYTTDRHERRVQRLRRHAHTERYWAIAGILVAATSDPMIKLLRHSAAEFSIPTKFS